MINYIITSDHHINSQLGLCAPSVAFDSGGKYEYNERQSVIWKYWLDFCNKVNKLQGDKVVVFNGDVFDLDNVSQQRISSNEADIIKMGLKTLEPLLSVANYTFIIRGTEYHTGNAGHLEETFSERISAEKCLETGTNSWWHLRQNIDGVNIEVAHHTSIGSLPWSELNTPMRTIYETHVNNIRLGYPIPNLIFRGHVHTHLDTKDINPLTRFIITPSWQSKTAYGYKRAINKRTEHGGTIVKINNGSYELENILYVPRKEAIWTL